MRGGSKMSGKLVLINIFLLLYLCLGAAGCADKKNLADIQANKLSEYSDRRGQANVKLYRYSGDVKLENIKAFTEKLGCRMLYAYFYSESVPMSEIPVEEVRTARSFTDVQEILFQGEGYGKWRFSSRCFALIPIVTDCLESPVSQDCR